MKKMIKRIISSVCSIILVMPILSSCNKQVTLLTRDDWNIDVKNGLNDLITAYSNKNNYVVFDFDNTSAIFDIEEQLIVYQLESMSFAIAPDELDDVLMTGLEHNKQIYQNMVDDICAAYKYLWDKYGGFSPLPLTEDKQEEIQQDIYWQEFATKMRRMYDVACDNEITEISYPWITYWFTNMSDKEIYDMACKSHEKYSKVETELVTWNSPDIDSKDGKVSITWTKGITVSENIKELWKAFSDNGIDVWVCSASSIDAIKAAVDTFGLHSYCKGVVAMTNVMKDGKYIASYDYETGYSELTTESGWVKTTYASKAQTQAEGKVTGIINAIMPMYNGKGPIAGFMDSTGDFNFCTEFKDLKLVVCFNRANRNVDDGGGLIAELAMYQKDVLGYDLKKANKNNDTLYLLQGRDETGYRSLRNSEYTVLYGIGEKLYKSENNVIQYESMVANHMSTEEIINTYAIKTSIEDSNIGILYGFFDEYHGYHSR